MNILDKYITKKFLSTFFFIVLILTVIAVVIDLSQKLSKIQENGSNVSDAMLYFYPFWALWLVNTFLPIAVFITVIYFTSRITEDTEIVAITSSGVSFFRFSRPYLMVALGIGLFSLSVNHFFLPAANVKKNEYKYKYLLMNHKKVEYYANQTISSQISKDEYVFVNSYNRQNLNGSGFLYQKFKNLKLIEQTRATDIVWHKEDSTFILNNYFTRKILPNGTEKLSHDNQMKLSLKVNPDDLLPEGYAAEIMKTPALVSFIQRERAKGSGSINSYLNELNQRTSVSFSTIILTFLALSLSSLKRRGGIGINLAVGISMAFVYIFFGETAKEFSAKGLMSPFWASWLANIIFGTITLFLYLKRAFA